MFFFLRKLLFKCLELGLGLKTHFSLETRNPIFINFRLSSTELQAVQDALAPGYSLQKIRLLDSDIDSDYWLSLNLYEIRYPKKELSSIVKSRCEINTFVSGPNKLKGIYVFCGSPFVSKHTGAGILGYICDVAERIVMFIYGCGKLVPLEFQLTNSLLTLKVTTSGITADLAASVSTGSSNKEKSYSKLSDDYLIHNDISFFNRGHTFDRVTSNSSFSLARFTSFTPDSLLEWTLQTPFFSRKPDSVFYHLGNITYTIDALSGATFRVCGP